MRYARGSFCNWQHVFMLSLESWPPYNHLEIWKLEPSFLERR
jgi:hypothetical protein